VDAAVQQGALGRRRRAGQALQASLTDHVDRIIAVRCGEVDPARRRLVASVCADVLRSVFDDVAGRPAVERRAVVAELKLVITSYLSAALPGP